MGVCDQSSQGHECSGVEGPQVDRWVTLEGSVVPFCQGSWRPSRILGSSSAIKVSLNWEVT